MCFCVCVSVCVSCLTIWQVICVLGKNVVQYHNEIQYKWGIIKFNQNWYSITLFLNPPAARSAAEMVEKFNFVAVSYMINLCFVSGTSAAQQLLPFVASEAHRNLLNLSHSKTLSESKFCQAEAGWERGGGVREEDKKCLSWVRCHLVYCQFTLYIRVSFGPFATQEAMQCPRGREAEKREEKGGEKCQATQSPIQSNQT